MDRWDLLRNRIEAYLGERRSDKDRAYTSRRKRLASDLGMGDSTLKGFLPSQSTKSGKTKSGVLGLDKVGKLLSKREFQDLSSHFPELRASVEAFTEVQLEIDFRGFGISPELSTVRLPIGKEGRVRLTITKSA